MHYTPLDMMTSTTLTNTVLCTVLYNLPTDATAAGY